MQNNRNQIRDSLNKIFQDVFDDESLHISDQTSAADIDAWDSLMHISLVVTAEKAFNVRLSASEIAQFENVGALIDLIESRTKSI